MNTFTNEQYVKDQLRRARRLQWIGVLCVFISFFLSFGFGVSTLLVYFAYPFLIAGLPLWTIGRTTVRRLTTPPRADHVLNNELKGLSNKYSLHHYATVGGKPVSHLLIGPSGLVVMHSSDASGPVTCRAGSKGDRWKSNTNLLDRLSGLKPPVGNPTRDLDVAVAAARQLLVENGKPEVPVRGLVVFTRNPELEIESCTYSAVPANELKQAVRELHFEMGGEKDEGRSISTMLTSEDRRRLNSALSPQIAPVPAKPASARR